MTPAEYSLLALRTENSPTFVHLAGVPDVRMSRLLHAAIGICTETGELLEVLRYAIVHETPLEATSMREEAGDLFWYLALAGDALGLAPGKIFGDLHLPTHPEGPRPVFPGDALESLSRLGVETGKLQDILKRTFVYGKDFEPVRFENELRALSVAVEDVLYMGGDTVPATMEANIAKLETRYRSKAFTEGEATTRDLDAERAALTSGAPPAQTASAPVPTSRPRE